MLSPMSLSVRTTARWPRRHVEVLAPDARRQLERLGWRTTLEYRENHIRAGTGQLLEVVPVWTAEAEQFDMGVRMATASGPTQAEAWAEVLDKVVNREWTDVIRRLVLRPAMS